MISSEEVREAYEFFSQKSLEAPFLLIAFSGARASDLREMLESFNSKMLYEFQKGFARYFLYSNGRVLYVYAPTKVLEAAAEINPNTLTRIRYKKVAPRSLRLWFATLALRLGVPECAINYMQGRLSYLTTEEKRFLNIVSLCDRYYPAIAETIAQMIGMKL
ncbi:integrase [Thermococcus sp. LS2]|uniref:integrase n=1 Tax=Thermococcus sp. LS2 TaxID=1638260 RepID=UPI00143A9AF9|nr:integrase [Thermococcus sp. LS2]NJE11994.1 hypothetical protein [Thermococcus sp. LS2]